MHAVEDGAEGQIRTDDTRLFRAVLYQLSYLGPSGRRPSLVVAYRHPTIAQGSIERQIFGGSADGVRVLAELARQPAQDGDPLGDRRMRVPHRGRPLLE